jgi:hypothetical protein
MPCGHSNSPMAAPRRARCAFYTDSSGWIVAGGSLSLLAIVLVVLFASGVRAILREYEGDDLFATTAFGGAQALMPRWLALLLCVVGLAFLTPLSRYLLAPSILLLVVASVQLLRNEVPAG